MSGKAARKDIDLRVIGVKVVILPAPQPPVDVPYEGLMKHSLRVELLGFHVERSSEACVRVGEQAVFVSVTVGWGSRGAAE